MNVSSDGFAAVAAQHLRDTLNTSAAQRWEWLMEAMQSAWALAQFRARNGKVTLGPHGDVLWSPQQQADWERVCESQSSDSTPMDALSRVLR